MSKMRLFYVVLCCLSTLGSNASMAGIKREGLPGGYSSAEAEKDVEAAANFAIREIANREGVVLNLRNISEAEKQVVAGMNYRFILTLDRAGKTRQAKVVVFRDLKSRYSLTSWEWL